MEEITIYRADDGTDFDDEYDCLYYEWSTRVEDGVRNLPLKLLSENYNELSLRDTDSYNDCYFIFIGSEEAAEFLSDIWDCDMVEVYAPRFLNRWGTDRCGLWAYDEEAEDWYHLGNKLAELQDMADHCMQVVNGA